MQARLALLMAFVAGSSVPFSRIDGAMNSGEDPPVRPASALSTSNLSNSPAVDTGLSYVAERNGEAGTGALLRIEVSDQRTFKVYDMQGNLIDSQPSDLMSDDPKQLQEKNTRQEKGAPSKRIEDLPKSPDAKPYDLKTQKANPQRAKDLMQEQGAASRRIEDQAKSPDAKPYDGKTHKATPQREKGISQQGKTVEDQPRSPLRFDIRTDPETVDLEPQLKSPPPQKGRNPGDSPEASGQLLYSNLASYTGTGASNVYTYNGTTHVLEVWSSVWNSGTTVAGSFRIGWYLSANNIISTGDYLIDYGIQPGLSSGYYVNWNLSADLDIYAPLVPAGTYYVGVYFDDLGQVAESNETDNAVLYTNTIYFPGVQMPNVTLYTGSGSSNVYTYNGTSHALEVWCSVWNNGTTAAGSFRIGWYLSANNIISTGDYLIGSAVQPGLTAGYYINWNLSADLDVDVPNLPAGTYYVGVYYDDQGQVAESNETDNAWPYTNTILTDVERTDNNIPETFSLEQNYPNPFNPTTKIAFHISQVSTVSLKVSDLTGKTVAVLVNGRLSPGTYATEWNATGFASGVYFYQLKADDFVQSRKLILLK